MNQIGFPENLRKVSIANGSLNGTLNNLPCQMAYEMEYSFLGIRLAFAEIYQQPGYGDICTVFEGRFTDYDLIHGGVIIIYVDNYGLSIGSNENSCSYDVAPGGTYDTYQQIEAAAAEGDKDLDPNNAILESHSFISTKSALAFTGSDQDLAEDLSNRNLVSTGETPFDSYWGPFNKNMEHIVEIDEDLFYWKLNEINNVPMMPPIANLQISGPTTVCSSWVTYTLNNLPDGFTVNWHSESNHLIMNSDCTPDPGAACISVKAASSTTNSSDKLIAIVSGPTGYLRITHDIWVGTPVPTQPTVQFNPGMQSVCKGESHTSSMPHQPDVTDYQWRLIYPDGFSWPLESNQSWANFCIDDTGGPYKVV